jgi:N utilization substance protein B
MTGQARKEIYQLLRSRAREASLQVLYQDDLNPQVSPTVGDSLLGERFPMTEFLELANEDLLRLARHAFPSRSRLSFESLPHAELAQQVRQNAMEFGRGLVDGVRRNRAQIDDRIARAAEHWSLERMAVTDRNVLRLGVYELLYTDAPPRVVIDEAIDLAKRFGTAQSGPFVNGILDKLMHEGNRKHTETENAAEPQGSPEED